MGNITPCTSSKLNRRFGGTYQLHLQGRKISQARNQCESNSPQIPMFATLVSCLVYYYYYYYICSFETSVDFQHTKRRYIPEDGPHNNRCANLKSCRFGFPSRMDVRIFRAAKILSCLSYMSN
jgi:hypothetical protein